MNFLRFLFLACFWGGSFLAIKFLIADVQPFLAATLRVGLSFLFLTLLFCFQKKKPSIPKDLRFKLLLASLFFQGIPFLLLFWGERFVSPGLAGILNGTVPLWTYLVSLIFFKGDELFSKRKLFGLLIGFVGMYTLFSPQLNASGNNTELLGIMAIVGMAICYGIGTVMNRFFLSRRKDIHMLSSLYYQHIGSFLFMCCATLLFEGKPQFHSLFLHGKTLASLLYLSFFSTALAWIFFFHLLKEWGSVRTVSVTYVVPFFAVLFDYLFLGNLPGRAELIGAFGILIGVMFLQHEEVKKLILRKHRARPQIPC
ncbi:MAG: EamA/RhaT family transporter [Deltaproteobacteria bacterium CG_4_10_14_0_2_um_filter_43_8]|nr:MAG: EamA family transporter [Deltaproteobacteria bacterium CG11_big_fil_rev_8_21_14_0_20_42_23]PJA19949.1 MAG: EamA/RhaT family transporter [Deltaproteobacteria bacterium CG_4_10_14_0_2_um_filter_43_8]PJC63602.1 MAG: EamA/RhaT family transporter [Deltaproteobacteria bacterium CG_4_9_14_0_2_um_filter_42_21]